MGRRKTDRNVNQRSNEKGRWPANVILDEESAEMLDRQSGELKSGGSGKRHKSNNSLFVGTGGNAKDISDSGGASRFFYCAKASRSERGNNNHPTCKPVKLMEYLIKLVSREGALILDPFLGSGTTMLACQNLGRKCIGIEQSEEYCNIARDRCKQMVIWE